MLTVPVVNERCLCLTSAWVEVFGRVAGGTLLLAAAKLLPEKPAMTPAARSPSVEGTLYYY